MDVESAGRHRWRLRLGLAESVWMVSAQVHPFGSPVIRNGSPPGSDAQTVRHHPTTPRLR